LIDQNHELAELYNFINVPAAVWIDERGKIVRPPDNAGACDAFRAMDRTTFRMPAQAADQARQKRKSYIAALKDWIENGDASKYLVPPAELRRLLSGPGPDDRLAAAYFRLGIELNRRGRTEEAQKHFARAHGLRPESWSFRRQAWELEQPGKAAGPEFWSAVDALGDHHYYPPGEL
jgi:tetratricopeptide (TPR) repeat protein